MSGQLTGRDLDREVGCILVGDKFPEFRRIFDGLDPRFMCYSTDAATLPEMLGSNKRRPESRTESHF